MNQSPRRIARPSSCVLTGSELREHVVERPDGRVLAGMIHGHAFAYPKYGGASEVGIFHDDALGEDDTRVSLLAVHGVLDQCGLELDDVAGLHARADPVQLHVVRHVNRAVGFWPCPGERAPRAADGSADERSNCVTLSIVGACIDQYQRFAVSFVNRSWPVGVDREVQAVQRNVLERSMLDVPGPSTFTLAVRRERVEIARASIITIARDEHYAFQSPAWLRLVHVGALQQLLLADANSPAIAAPYCRWDLE